jgi:hypothetical protein
MVAAILFALLYAAITIIPVYGFKFRFYLLTAGPYNVIPELAVAGVGLAALLICGVLSLTLRGKPAVAQTAWIVAGKTVLLAAPVGYIRSQLLRYWSSSNQMDFLTSFAILAAVFVGYAWSMRPRDGLADPVVGVRPRRILRGTAIVGGIMLASLTWLLVLQWKSNSSLMENWTTARKLEYLLWMPLHATLPVVLSVTVGYPLLSLAARLDESPRKGRFGKGTILLGWVTLGMSVLCSAVSVLINYRLLNYNASDLMGDFGGVQKLYTWQSVLSTATALLGIWTLCGILSRVRESKTALWGARGVLGVVVLRYLSAWIVDAVVLIMQMNKESSGMGIIGGADMSVTLLSAKVNSWLNPILALLSVIALCILTVGLVRNGRVSKAFWAVPALSAASIVASLLVSIVWELFLRSTNTDSALTLHVMIAVTTSVITVARSIIGVLALARTPAEEVPPPPTATEGEEPPKPRVEDYLYQL